ncbi:alpha/beta hydrolase [Streptomyces microflavus]|uniref:alpha/beta hydrolase n=1 Tax=Streptomyces microflavus TaxID=1919 RepID=UPI0034150DEB
MNVVVCELDPGAVSTALVTQAAGLDPDLRTVPADRLAFPVPSPDGAGVAVLHLVGADDGVRDRRGVMPSLPVTKAGALPAALLPDGVVPEIVVLDSCYLPAQAHALTSAVPVVVGLPGRLGRPTADAFLEQWYAALGRGETAGAAFEAGCDRIAADDLPEVLRPRLHRHLEKPPLFRRGGQAGGETVTVWYGTNRVPLDDGGFGDLASPELHRGSCTVEVPASAPIGGRPRRRLGRADGSRRLAFLASRPLDRAAYLTDVADALDATLNDRRAVFVYVHGYRTTFEEAAVRAAQLHMDLKIPGITAFFSWPSRGTAHGYSADEDAVQLSERHLCAFLADLCAKSSAKKVHLLAHSMGSRAVLRVAMRAAENSSRTQGIELGQLVLAAPDIDGAFFAAEADAFRHIAEGTTLYTSSRDLALQSSSLMHRGPRAGQGPPFPTTEGMHVIDAAPIDVSLLGHGYYAAAFPVLGDIHSLIYDRHDPSARMALRGLSDGRWGFRELD